MISPSTHPCPQWLSNAIFYEIYPQSFADSNGDGIGDIPGITAKLGYITDLGCNAIWLNPCFDSPFKDAGYDVRDYKKVAPRYGTNDDLAVLFAAAHERGMHVSSTSCPATPARNTNGSATAPRWIATSIPTVTFGRIPGFPAVTACRSSAGKRHATAPTF